MFPFCTGKKPPFLNDSVLNLVFVWLQKRKVIAKP